MAEELTETPARLDVLKTLGDNTRYAIYLELARSASPLTTADVAKTLDLHVNTVRPHLERMRDVGLLDVHTESLGGVGRPQHRYTLAADAPSLGLEPPTFPMLARMLLRLAAEVGAAAEDAVDAGREQGRHDALTRYANQPCTRALITHLDTLGFDPQVVPEDDAITIGFAHCPFAELAERNPDLVCGLHRGIVEGFVDELGGARVGAFRTLVDRSPCQMDLVS
jgi:predicted ArsR family transcriptional regulator